MRTTIVTLQQRVLVTLVKWTSLFLILLAVMAGTISGELPIARTNFSRTFVPAHFAHFYCPPVPADKIQGDPPNPFSSQGCVYTPTDNGQCVAPYKFQGSVCTTDPKPVDSNTSFCLLQGHQSAKYCQQGQPCFQNLTINGCTFNTYCLVHSDDTASCSDPGVSTVSFCVDLASAKYCQQGQPCFKNQTIDGCTVGTYCQKHSDDTASCPTSDNPPTTIQAPNSQSTKSDCPSGDPKTTGPNGEPGCKDSDGGIIIPSPCSPGFVDVNNTCYSNSPVDLSDASTDKCTLTPQGEEGEGSGEENGTQIYWCPYANGTLRCVITGTSEQCTMTKSGNTVGFFTCQGLNAGYPKNCAYYGTVTSTNTQLASANCAQGICSIRACWNTNTSLFSPIAGASCTADFTHISVLLKEKCTPQVDGQKRVCDYNSIQGVSSKSVTLSISCDANQLDTTDLSCTVTDPYSVIFNKQCVNSQQENQGIDATCSINASLWTESCDANGSTSTIPDCTVLTNDNLTLGKLHCDSASSCTITSADGINTIKISCGNTCRSDTPDCPHPAVPTVTAITEATIACDAKLVADMVMYGNGVGPKKYTIITPLSQIEIEFVLLRIGAGSQTWFPDSNLPAEVTL
jgi:hypothetical protein